jgi:DNA-binding response OmpR family regulator
MDLQRILSGAGAATGKWTLHVCPTLAAAKDLLDRQPVAIAVCDAVAPDGVWIDLLENLIILPDPPPLIVTSRLADEQLWATALNLGAYDVLPKPYWGTEVVRSLGSAFRHSQSRTRAAEKRASSSTAASSPLAGSGAIA